MAFNVVKVNYALNVGEVSARFEGRQDKLEKYGAACRQLDNWLPLTMGGVTRRPGWGFAAKAKFSGATNNTVILVDFRFSSTQAYTLEFGDLYVRFFKDGAPVMRATQAVTNITQASSAVVTYTGADNYIVGNKVTLTGVVGMTEINGLLGTITAVNTGANTFTVNIDSTGFTAYSSGGVINTPFELVTPYPIADLDLIKIGSFQSADVMYIATGIYPVQKLARIAVSPDRFTIGPVAFNPPATIEDEPTGAEIGSGDLTLSALTGSGQTATLANAVTLAGDAGRVIVSGAGRAIITAVSSSTVYAIDIIDNFDALTIAQDDWHLEGFGDSDMNPNRRQAGEGVTVVAGTATFRSSDVGKYMTIYGGLIKLQTFLSSTQMNGTILNTLRDVPNDPTTGLPFNDPPATKVWTIEVPAWTADLGYPNCGCFFQSRMWLCKGQTINGSVTGDFENFSKGSNADDAIQRTIDDDQVNPIRWIKGLRTLQLGTGGSAYEVTASSQGKALTPSDFTVLPISSRGGANIPPMKVGGQLIYVQFGQKKLRELVFDFVTDKFKSPSLFILAEHLTEFQFVVDCAYQQEPDSVIWAARDDGMLLALTYQEDENVIGWSKHPTAGKVKSICVIPRPSTGKDWLFAAIDRAVNGVTETFVEFMEPDADLSREWHELETDCAKIAVPDANLLIIGADHLEGETVKVIGDGMLMDDAVVTDGQFTVTPTVAVSQVEYGLPYESIGVTLEPPISVNEGGMFLCRRWKDLGVRVRRAGPGLTLNVADSDDIGLPVRSPEHPMGVAVPLQEGKLCAPQTNWGAFQRVTFQQTLPFPAEIININGSLEIGTDPCCDTVDENPEFGGLADSATIFGLLRKECNHNCPLGQFAQIVYNGGVDPVGPFIRGSEISTVFSFVGLVALYIPAQTALALVQWSGEPISTLGTVLTAVTQTLVVDDVLRIEVDSIDTTIYRVKVNGTTVITRTIDSADLAITNGCVGILATPATIPDPIVPPVTEGGPDVIVIKAADESKTADTTIAADTELKFAMLAGETWVFDIVALVLAGNSTPDISYTVLAPSGSVGQWEDVNLQFAVKDFGVTAGNNLGTIAQPLHIKGTVTCGGTPGDCAFGWAQLVSNAAVTTVAQYSQLIAFKQ